MDGVHGYDSCYDADTCHNYHALDHTVDDGCDVAVVLVEAGYEEASFLSCCYCWGNYSQNSAAAVDKVASTLGSFLG